MLMGRGNSLGRRRFLPCLAALLLAPVVAGQGAFQDGVVNQAHRDWLAAELAQNQMKWKGNPDVLLHPGVVANRKERRVEVLAAATGVAKGAPTEFFLVGRGGKEYEALAATGANARHILAALEFIGMKAGQPVAPRLFRFWPKGERVSMTIEWEEAGPGGEPATHSLRAEEALLNTASGKALPKTGLAFVGSTWIEAGDGSGRKIFQAEAAGDIASNFNAPWTLLDVPYLAEQGAIYGTIVPNPKHLFRTDQRLRFVLRPMLPPGQKRVQEFRLLVAAKPATTAAAAADLRFTLAPAAGKPVLEGANFDQLLALLQERFKAGKDIFLAPCFAPELPLTALREFCAMLRRIAAAGVVRVEPGPGELYYESFFPRAAWWDRQKRLAQPLEIYLVGDRDRVSGRMIYLREDFTSEETELRQTAYPFANLALLKKIIATKEEWDTRTIFMYVNADTRYAEVLACYQALRDRFPVAYIFPPRTKPAKAAPR